MNAIISLCHFCELHGPSVTTCTQAFHSPEPDNCCESAQQASVSDDIYSKEQPNSWDCLRDSWNEDCKSTAASLSAPASPTLCSAEKQKTDSCEACTPFSSSRPGFISRDTETRVCYVTCHHPRNAEVFTVIRQACLRSLSCEVYPGREGPIFFGDDHRSQVLSYAFNLQDSHARGCQRLFSVTVVMMDKIFLLNSWPFLVKHIQLVVDYLKSKSSAVFTDEIARYPNRTHRIQTRQRGCGGKPTRSLLELTADSQVFERLHRAFTWMLKAGGDRLTEKLLEGPVTEGCVIDLNRLEETEEGFMKVRSQRPVMIDQTVRRDVDIDDVMQPSVMITRFTQLKQFVKVIGPNKFHTVAHHVLIGNQVIVRCSCKLLVRTVLDCLKTMLPKGCSRVVYYSAEYVPSYKCNFLGISVDVSVPVDTALCVLIDAEEAPAAVGGAERVSEYRLADEVYDEVTAASGPASMLLCAADTDELCDLSSYHYSVVHSSNALPAIEPTVLAKIEKTLTSDSLADVVLERSLICLKEDWMNKVKRMFLFTKVGYTRQKEEMDKLLQVMGAQEQDKMLLKFWMSGLSVDYQLNKGSDLL